MLFLPLHLLGYKLSLFVAEDLLRNVISWSCIYLCCYRPYSMTMKVHSSIMLTMIAGAEKKERKASDRHCLQYCVNEWQVHGASSQRQSCVLAAS